MLYGLWQSPLRINAADALSLQQAQLMLDGAMPYVDFVDANSPMMTYLALPSAALASMLHLSPIPLFTGLVILLVLISSVELDVLLRQRRLALPEPARVLLMLTWIVSYFIVDWRGDVGQIDHLFILLYIPFLFLRILHYRGGSVADSFALLLGVQAGIGAGLRPIFLLAAVNVELIMLFTSRLRRTLAQSEIYAFVVASGVILAHWMIVPAPMRKAFFEQWLPLVNYGYGTYNATYEQLAYGILGSPVTLAAAAGILTAAMICIRRRARYHQYFVALVSLAGMAILLVLLQKKGWSCQRIPLNIAGLLCLVMLGIEGAGRWTTKWRRSIGVGQWVSCGLILGLLLAAWFIVRENTKLDPPDVAALRRILEEHSQPGDHVFVVSSFQEPAYPLLLQMNRLPGSRYPYAFPVACFYSKPMKANQPAYRPRSLAPAEEKQFLTDVEDDCSWRRPELILIQNQTGAVGLPKDFNLYDYLFYTGCAQKILKPYQEMSGPEGWKVFERAQVK
jgi:hypothetical protein